MSAIDKITNCWKKIGIFGDSTCPKLSELIHCRNCIEYNKAGRSLFNREVTNEFLEETTKNLTDVKKIKTLDFISVIIFRIENEWLALRTIYLQETTNMRPIHRVPFRTNNVFKGIVNINGELLLCVSLTNIMENTSEETRDLKDENTYKRMLVIHKNNERYVFPVDEVLGIYRISSNEIQGVPATISKSPSSLIEGIFNLNENKVGLLGEDRFLQALKRSLVS